MDPRPWTRQTQRWSCPETLGELKLPLDVDRYTYRRAGVSLVVRLSSELKPRALGGGETADFEENRSLKESRECG